MKPFYTVIRRNADWMLILSCVPLFATKTLFNLPVAVMAMIGAVRLARSPGRYARDPALHLIAILFLCFWVPMWLSLPDAANPGRSLSTTLIWLRFPLAAVFVVDVLRDAQARARLFTGTAVLVGLWCVDALIQFFAGVDLLGYPYNGHRLSGIFHPKLRLGTVTAALAPVYVEWVRRQTARTRWAWLLLLPMLGAVALAGNRTGWVMLAVALSVYGVHRLLVAHRLPGARAVALWAVVLMLGALLPLQYGPFKHRVETTLGLFSGSWEKADQATAYRLSIWATTLNVIRAHWLNGVGPRGFHAVYMDHVHERDQLVHRLKARGTTHPHQVTLEIAAETGVIGLAGFAAFWAVFLVRLGRALRRPDYAAAAPWVTAALVAAFPLNAHMSFYASYWSTIFWWLLTVAVAVWAAPRALGCGAAGCGRVGARPQVTQPTEAEGVVPASRRLTPPRREAPEERKLPKSG